MKVKVRMPNELFYDEIEIESKDFEPKSFFDHEVFGLCKGMFVAMEIESYNKLKEN